MAKKTPRTKCLDAAQLLSRLKHATDEGYCECWSCDKIAHYTEMDGGHYIPKGKSSYWALEEENIHPQCKSCNGFGMKFGSAAQQYTLKMIDYYGKDFVDEMLKKQGEIRKLYKRDYEDILSGFNEQIRHHKKRIGV